MTGSGQWTARLPTSASTRRTPGCGCPRPQGCGGRTGPRRTREANGLEGDRLTAGVGAGNEPGCQTPSPSIRSLGTALLGSSRGWRARREVDPPGDDPGLGPLHPVGELGPGKIKSHQQDELVVVLGAMSSRWRRTRRRARPGCARPFLPGLELPEAPLLALTTPMGSMKKVEPERTRSAGPVRGPRSSRVRLFRAPQAVVA